MLDLSVTIVSFGYGHQAPPEADIVLDLRRHFRDPHVNPELRYLTARDEPVQTAVAGTAGIAELVSATAQAVCAYLSGPSAQPVSVACGCVGGRHRAPAVAQMLTERLRTVGFPVTVQHRDIDRPVITR